MAKEQTIRQKEARARLSRIRAEAVKMERPRIVNAGGYETPNHIVTREHKGPRSHAYVTKCGKVLKYPDFGRPGGRDCAQCGGAADFEAIREEERKWQAEWKARRDAEMAELERKSAEHAAKVEIALADLRVTLELQGIKCHLSERDLALVFTVDGVELVARER